MVDLVREVLLPLLGQEAESCAADDPVHHVQVTAHAAVHVIQDDTLLGHVVLDDDDAVGTQAPLAAPQELGQVLIGQVAWGRQRPLMGRAGPARPRVAFSTATDFLSADCAEHTGRTGSQQPRGVHQTPL